MLPILSTITSVYLLIGIIYFGAKKPAYSHRKDTISELGAQGSKFAGMVNNGLFLPVGMLLFTIALLNTTNSVLAGLSLSLGIGYMVAGFFPCDPGSPLRGTVRQQIHNIGGFIEYAGGLVYLMRASNQGLRFFSLDYKIAGYGLIVCIILISLPKSSFRGLAQRAAELILFGSLVQLSF